MKKINFRPMARALACAMAMCSLTLVSPTTAQAQSQGNNISIGTISQSRMLKQMPQYAEAQRNLKNLSAQYESEAQRSEKEFQTKFEEFLHTQKEMSPTILNKRQNELQMMMDANIQFRLKVQTLLKNAETDLMAEVKSQLKEAIASAAAQRGIAIVINTDDEGLSYIIPGMTVDLTDAVMHELGIAVE